MIARFFILFQFTLGMINFTEFYPVCIRSIAIGCQTMLSSVGDALSTIVFSDVSQIGINPFLLSSVLFLVLLFGKVEVFISAIC